LDRASCWPRSRFSARGPGWPACPRRAGNGESSPVTGAYDADAAPPFGLFGGLIETINRMRASKMKIKNRIKNTIKIRITIKMKMTNRSD
jgi:hypothetical protein